MSTEQVPSVAETVGVRDLKNHATQLVRRVREDKAEFVITVNGEPVAIMRPLDEAEAVRLRHRAADSWLAEAASIADEVAKYWPPQVTAAESIDNERRGL